VIKFCWEPTDVPALMPACGSDEIHRWLVADVVPSMKKVCRAHGILKTDQGVDRMDAAETLLVVQHTLFMLDSDWQVNRLRDPYGASGAGREIAAGVCHAMAYGPGLGLGADAAGRGAVLAALRAAAAHSTGVAGPFTLIGCRDQAQRWEEVA
jgi:hypothetical protein